MTGFQNHQFYNSFRMAEREEEVDDQLDQNYDPEAEVIGNWKKVDLPEITLKTGEEDDEEITKFRTKLYRFRNGEWKERGVGELKFLKNKNSGKVRLLMRAEKTHKVVINHLLQRVATYCVLEPMKTSSNAWTWAAYDISDEKPQAEKFAGKVTSKEQYERFEKEFNSACESNEKAVPTTTTTTTESKAQTPATKEETKPETPSVPKEEPKTEEPKPAAQQKKE